MSSDENLGSTAPSHQVSRRQVVSCAGCAALGLASGWFLRGRNDKGDSPVVPSDPAQGALKRLQEGNQRFAAGTMRHSHENQSWREALVADQHPFAIVLGCSDSRVPVEVVFDQGLGDLFVIRVAGNVIATDVVGSIAYAITHLQTKFLVVMGHEGCGAVTAALQAEVNHPDEPKSIAALVNRLAPSLKDLPPQLEGAARLSAAVEANVRWSMSQLAAIPTGKKLLESGEIEMVGAVYELATGRVRFLDS